MATVISWTCTVCRFDSRDSFLRADQHEHETGHLVVLTEAEVTR